MVEIGNILTEDNLQNLCRLCLKVDDFIIDIFNHSKSNKISLPDRIYDFYQVKISKSDGLPTNICNRCLYFTENFTEFRDNVRKCEAKLQKHMVSIGIMGSEKLDLLRMEEKNENQNNNNNFINNNQDYSEFLPDSYENLMVTVVDPNQEYESSNESFSLDSDNPDYPSPIKKSTPEVDSKKLKIFGFSPDLPITTSSSQNTSTNSNNNNTNNNDSLLDLMLESTTRNVFLCQYCDMAFKLKNECGEHETRHDLAYPFSCTYCPYRCTVRQSLVNHIKELHDPERPYVCVLCNKGFVRRSDLKKHTIVHTGVRPFACPVCGKNFSRNTNLTKHMRVHSGVTPHICQKCPRSFMTPGDLMRHQKSHNDLKAFKCNKCDSSFTRKDKLVHHERIHLKKEIMKPIFGINNTTVPNNVGQENLTNLIPNNRERLNFDPENMVISLDPYSDINQGENFEQKNLFQRQQQAQQNLPSQSDLFTKSKDTIIEQNNLKDDKIPKTSDLITEKPQQRRNRIHVCTVCGKAFTRKRELQRHVVIHSGLKPFGCRFCNKRFNRKDKVIRHERIHTEEKYPCNQCKLVFSKQEALDMHIKVHGLNKMNTPPQHEVQKIPNFLESLQEGVTPQLNFYSEIRPE